MPIKQTVIEETALELNRRAATEIPRDVCEGLRSIEKGSS